jgi:hypothetical protein
MSCRKTVEQYIERGADQGYRVDTIDSPCGSTGQHLESGCFATIAKRTRPSAGVKKDPTGDD